MKVVIAISSILASAGVCSAQHAPFLRPSDPDQRDGKRADLPIREVAESGGGAHCGCDSCTQQVWDTPATDGGGAYTCGDRITYLQRDRGYDEARACTQVSSEFKTICGLACDPLQCNQPPLSFGCDRILSLPPVPTSNIGDTSFDVMDVGDFGINDFRIEMDVTGKGFSITGSAINYGTLFIRSGEAGPPYSGPSVFIYDNGNVKFRLRNDDELVMPRALPNPTDTVTRHLVFSRTGSTLIAVIDGTKYERTITNGISDVETLREAPLRFRGNHVNPLYQSVYMDVSMVKICQRKLSNSPSKSLSKG